MIQVFSSADQAQAERIRKQLVGGGQKAYLSPIDVAGHTMYRVRIGPFNSRPTPRRWRTRCARGTSWTRG